MRKTITYHQLLTMETEILSIQEALPGLAILLADRIDRFFNKNSSRLHMAHTKMQALQSNYLVMVEGKNTPVEVEVDGKMEVQYKVEAKNAHGTTVTGENVREWYLQESGEFLHISFDAEW